MTNYNDGNWHGWNGGERPVHPETVVDVVFDTASVEPFYRHVANDIYWENSVGPSDIIAFRVIKEHREPRDFWICKTRGSDGVALEFKPSGRYDEVIHVREVIE